MGTNGKGYKLGPGILRFKRGAPFDPRSRRSKEREPLVNNLYRKITPQIFGVGLCKGEETIYEGDEGLLDKNFGIDTILTLRNGNQITLQEKFLESSFNTVTIEYEDVPDTIPGDWFKLASQLYFVGYFKDDLIRNWILLDLVKVWQATGRKEMKWQLRDNYTQAQANFVWIDFESIPKDCILAKASSRLLIKVTE